MSGIGRIAWVLAGLGIAALPAWGQSDGPPLEGPVEMRLDEGRSVQPTTAESVPLHEAIAPPTAIGTANVRVAKAPPPPIVEHPGDERPSPASRWVEGYWAWDAARGDYAWVPGAWRVPPPGMLWVGGSWARDDRGWYRVPGRWSARATRRVDWRADGPPADHSAEVIGPPPGPDQFWVPGVYVPDGDGLAWRPGFWSKAHPGWEWVPAHWVRLADGWTYREGRWDRAVARPTADPSPFAATTARRIAARPVLETTDLAPIPETTTTETSASPPANEADAPASDPIAAREASARARAAALAGLPPGVYVVGPDGRLIAVQPLPGRPGPARAPFGPPSRPGGFVRNRVMGILDRVLP